MNKKLIIIAAIFEFLILPGIVLAQNITITQLDTRELLISSKIDCYLSITDVLGEPLEDIKTDLISFKHETEGGMNNVEILDIQRNNLSEWSTTFLLILDNSGSMYEAVGDGMTGNRMDHAIRAVREFIKSLDNDDTRVGLAIFNTKYKLLIKPGSNVKAIEEALDLIEKPDKDSAYTELYYSINQASLDMSIYGGRKAVVLLSDGENYPYYSMTGKLHPDLGDNLYLPSDGLESLNREGVTLYGVNFSKDKDKSLASISVESGGAMYDAVTDEELSGVYDRIKTRIEKEYRVTVRVPLVFLGSPKISAKYNGSYDTQTYFSRTLLGHPEKKYLYISLVILLLSLIIWAVLMFLRFEKPASHAEISMLSMGMGIPSQRTIALTSPMTVIGGSANADFTVAGIPSLKESHATIIQDEKTGTYTLVSEEEVRVNNRLTNRRKLEPGDVINVEGATIIFDEPKQ